MRSLFLIIAMFVATYGYSQFELGVRAGVSTQDLADGAVLDIGNPDIVKMKILGAGYGYHFGLYSNISFWGIFVEPAVLFHSSKVDYDISQEVFDTGIVHIIKSETYHDVEVPVMMGVKILLLRLYAGPVAKFHIDSMSDLFDIKGYTQNFHDARFAIAGGIGLKISRFRVDFRYHAPLHDFGDHITIGGTPYAFDKRPARLELSLGYRF